MVLDAQSLAFAAMSQRALILTDRKPGHENQSLALCAMLGWKYKLIPVSPSKQEKALYYLQDWLGCRPKRLIATGGEASVRAVVSTGSSAFFPARCTAAHLRVPHIAILFPRGFRLDDTACILAPQFDQLPQRDNIIRLPSNLCVRDLHQLRACQEEFRRRHTAKRPAIGVMIGGSNAVSTMDVQSIGRAMREAFSLYPEHEFWLTTSRRTPDEVVACLETFPFSFSLIFSETDRYNPIPHFIESCERLFVTSDSSSMISESVSFGQAAVEVLMNDQTGKGNKFERFIADLAGQGCVHIFDGNCGEARKKVDMSALAQEVQQCISCNFSRS